MRKSPRSNMNNSHYFQLITHLLSGKISFFSTSRVKFDNDAFGTHSCEIINSHSTHILPNWVYLARIIEPQRAGIAWHKQSREGVQITRMTKYGLVCEETPTSPFYVPGIISGGSPCGCVAAQYCARALHVMPVLGAN
jgi:hypothetical protein